MFWLVDRSCFRRCSMDLRTANETVPQIKEQRTSEAGRRGGSYCPSDQSVLEVFGDLLMTGPTLTNVNDFRAILIETR